MGKLSMYNGRGYYAFVPLRSDSKGIHNKNIKEFCGEPLCYWVLKELSKIKQLDRIIVSIDKKEYQYIIGQFGFDVYYHYRSKESANDINHWEIALEECIKEMDVKKNDIFVMCQTTNPFIRSNYIEEALILNNLDLFSIVSCTRIKKFLWSEDGQPVNFNHYNRPMRQWNDGDLIENGSFYINSVKNILKFQNRLSDRILPYECGEKYTELNIETKDEFKFAEELFKKYELGNR